MGNEGFKIYVDRISNEKEELINESFSPDFLSVKEEDLRFKKELTVEGRAYLVDKELLLELDVRATVEKPCAVCNKWGELEVALSPLIHAEPLSSARSGIFDFSTLLREELLLQIPRFWKCNNGHCPQEEGLSKYFAKKGKKNFQENPFANIDLPEVK
jgi:uncharacterized metal-binding protein YceD (DUF177 family)